MKKKILLFIIISSLIACQSDNKSNLKSMKDSLKKDTLHSLRDSSRSVTIKATNSLVPDVAKMLLGVWIVKNSETGNASFLLRESQIYYPETEATYPYKLEGDSLVIKYEDYVQHLGFKFHGKDTLVLVGEDGPNTFYRVKK